MRAPLTKTETAELWAMIDEIESLLETRIPSGKDAAERDEARQFMFDNFEACILAGTMALKSSRQ